MEPAVAESPTTIYTSWDQVPITLTPALAGNVLGITAETVRALIRSGSLPAIQVGDKYLINRDRLRKWFDESEGRVLDSVIESRTQARRRQGKER